MSEENGNESSRLFKYPVWQMMSLSCIVFIVVSVQITLFYFSTIPKLQPLVEASMCSTPADLIYSNVNILILNLSVWLTVLFLANLGLCYALRKARLR